MASIESESASDSETNNRPSPRLSAIGVEVLNKCKSQSLSSWKEGRCVLNLAAEDRYSSLYSNRVSVENENIFF